MTSLAGLLLMTWVLVASVECNITLEHLDTAYVPLAYANDGDTETFQYDVDLRALAVDKLQPFIYVIGENWL